MNNRFSEISYLKTVYNPQELGDSVAEVAFVGRSNVGKSTVLNVVCGKKNLARTSQTPGRTRTINVFLVSKNKWIVDLPGYGYAAGPKKDIDKFKEMIKGYLLSRPTLRMVIMIVDGYVGATKLDEQMSIWLQSNRIPFYVVANKCDRISSQKQSDCRKEVAHRLGLSPENMAWVSAEKGIGMSELRNKIAEILELT
jgi:GTP-binding protein